MKQEIEQFLLYTKNYISLGENITRKINHTFRVIELCEKIAISLNLSEEDIFVVKLCGLLHDIGRFEQWKKYQTFNDLKSIDHGDLGVEILKKNNFIRKFNNKENLDDLIFKTIKNHNKYKIDENLNEKETLFCNIVKDADKLDILYLYTIKCINIDIDNDDFSTKIYNDLLNQKEISRKDNKTKADHLAVSLGFIFGLNFKESYKILKENDYINKEIDIYVNKTKNEYLIEKLEKVRIILNKYIEGRC